MRTAVQRRGAAAALVAVAAVLTSCAPTQAEREALAAAERAAAERAAAEAARTPPPIALNQEVAEAAAVYVAFTREMAALHGGFSSPEAVQAALRQGSAYNPDQLSRGLVAYASIVALQSPEFVAGVRQYAGHPEARRQLVANIVADPRYASGIEGADAAATLVTAMLRQDIDALSRAADSIENDAYAVQAVHDPRRGWGVAEVRDRDGRLAFVKARSLETVAASPDETARLLAAIHSDRPIPPGATPRTAPYPPVVQRALAIAALAALGAADDSGRLNTDALQEEPVSRRCLDLSKLMLFQCLAASRPSYEDMFCIGRHVVRDLATCTRGAAMPAAIVTVSDVVPAPAITPAPFGDAPAAAPRQGSLPTPPPPPPPPPSREPRPTPSITERLNSQPSGD